MKLIAILLRCIIRYHLEGLSHEGTFFRQQSDGGHFARVYIIQDCAISIAHVSDSVDGRTDSFACHRPFNGPVGSGSENAVSNDPILEVALAVDPELV